MSKPVTICFETTEATQQSLAKVAQAHEGNVGEVINEAINQYMAALSKINRRAYGRVEVDMAAVARPIDGEVGTAILPGKILDLSEGGLKLQCHCQLNDLMEMFHVGGQVEIIFTVPEREYPICFTCEVRHIFPKDNSEVGCEFLNAQEDNIAALKSLLDGSLN